MKQQYEETMRDAASLQSYNKKVTEMLGEGWERTETYINVKTVGDGFLTLFHAIFRREINWCERAGCEDRATEAYPYPCYMPEPEAAPVKPPFVAQPMRPRAEPEAPEADAPTPAAPMLACLYVGCYETAEPDAEYCATHQLRLEEVVSRGL